MELWHAKDLFLCKINLLRTFHPITVNVFGQLFVYMLCSYIGNSVWSSCFLQTQFQSYASLYIILLKAASGHRSYNIYIMSPFKK